MPHISKYQLNKKAEEEIIANLNTALTFINSGEDMINFINSLLSPTERIMIAKRLAMIILIESGVKDSEISNLLHVTNGTVAKMRLFYEARGTGFKIALKKLEEQKRLKAFKDTLLELVDFIGKAGTGHVKKTFGSGNRFE